MSDILIIEDDGAFALALQDYLSSRGFTVDVVFSARRALDVVRWNPPRVVILDLFLPDANGLDLIPELSTAGVFIVVITGSEEVRLAVEAMRRGAHDFLVKPVDLEALALKLERNFPAESEHGLVGNSPAMRRVVEEAKLASRGRASVLILGETGVGKEEVARAIYRLSGRRGKFVAVNASAVPEALFESELFGHKRGAFTGASYSKKGLLEEAHGGVFFLDEISEMPPHLQAKLLRVLETRRLRRLGETRDVEVDFKFIASSNLSLDGVRQRLREDLFYRISTFIIEIPPLRERKEDILPLAKHFLREFGRDKGIFGLSPAAEELLQNYPWPGNVRELRNEIERACIVCGGKQLEPSHFSPNIRSRTRILTLEEMEREYIKKVVQLCGGNKSKAARLLGISRPTLRRKLSGKP